MTELPVTRSELAKVQSRLKALEDWTRVAVEKIKALEVLAATVRERLESADAKGKDEESSEISWD